MICELMQIFKVTEYLKSLTLLSNLNFPHNEEKRTSSDIFCFGENF